MTQLPDLSYARDDFDLGATRRTHVDRATSGVETRIANGVYVPTAPWLSLDATERYLLTIRAIATTRRHEMVLSHWSAAALHRLPIVGPWPGQVHVSIGRVSGGRTRRGVAKHALVVSDDELVEIDGMLVTSVARTLIDLAIYAGRLTAIVALDRALLIDRFGRKKPILDREALWNSYVARGHFRGAGRARRLLEFASCSSESPLESVSRMNMSVIGCPMPEQQVHFRDHDGEIGAADFYWRGFRLIGESDGDVKYLDSAMRKGRSAEQVVVDEKRREDRMRALGDRMTRWGWVTGVDPHALRAHLRPTGLPIR